MSAATLPRLLECIRHQREQLKKPSLLPERRATHERKERELVAQLKRDWPTIDPETLEARTAPAPAPMVQSPHPRNESGPPFGSVE